MTKPLNIIYMGTPEFAVPALKALHNSTHRIVCVYSQPPRPKGRGGKVQRSAVHQYANAQELPVFTPTSLKNKNEQDLFASHNADIAVVAAYGLILPKPILDTPQYGCLNIHASLLPRWRGASPIQQAIRNGDSETGISIMRMDEGLDTGPVLKTDTVPITSKTTTETLHDTLSNMGADLILKTVDQIANGENPPEKPQDNSLSTYAPLLKKTDGLVDWAQTAQKIDLQIRALNPWPGVRTDADEIQIKILEANPTTETTDQKPGTVLNKDGYVACGNNSILQLIKIQPAGAKAMDVISAINGHYIKTGNRLS